MRAFSEVATGCESRVLSEDCLKLTKHVEDCYAPVGHLDSKKARTKVGRWIGRGYGQSPEAVEMARSGQMMGTFGRSDRTWQCEQKKRVVDLQGSGLSDRKSRGTIHKDGDAYRKCRIRDGSVQWEMPAGFLSGEVR